MTFNSERTFFVGRSVLKVLFTIGLTMMSAAAFAAAGDMNSAACDQDLREVIESRAWMEGQREVEVAARLILKPDTVLEYSCFSNRVVEMGFAANDMLSDNVNSPLLFPDHTEDDEEEGEAENGLGLGPNGPNPPGVPLTVSTLNNILGMTVGNLQFEYERSSFGHTYAGGTNQNLPSGSSCNPMQLVWDFLKCSNFQKVDFRTFRELSQLDPRFLASYTQLSCNNPNRNTAWAQMLEAVDPEPGEPGAVEPMTTYMPKIDFAAAGGCSEDPIPTGLEVSLDGRVFNDAVCPTPGCYYDGVGSCN